MAAFLRGGPRVSDVGGRKRHGASASFQTECNVLIILAEHRTVPFFNSRSSPGVDRVGGERHTDGPRRASFPHAGVRPAPAAR